MHYMCLICILLSLLKNRSGECACTAYVTFKDAYALETAVLLSVSFFANSLGRKWVLNIFVEIN